MDFDDLFQELKDFEDSALGWGHDLRLDLADLILAEMTRLGWTQKKLADEAQVKASFVNRIIHAEANCTFDSAANLLFALGVKPRLVRHCPPSTSSQASSEYWLTIHSEVITHGQEESEQIDTSETGATGYPTVHSD